MSDMLRQSQIALAKTRNREPGLARILAVGEVERWMPSIGSLPAHHDLHFASLADLDSGLLALLQPRVVVSPLVSTTFDCLDVAARLDALCFDGAFRAMARGLPVPSIVLREVAALAPGLDFDIIEFNLAMD